MKRIGPSQVAIISTIEPVVTTIMATILFNDFLSFPQIMGGVLVISGIIVLQNPWKKDTDLAEDIPA
jgi:drug/metabolite transporter (DMT)-like permease